MLSNMRKFLFLPITTLVLFSCNTNDRYYIPKYSFSANEISNDFLHNSKIVAEKYQGKKVEIEGYVQTISKNNDGKSYLVLEGYNNKIISCNLSADNTTNEDQHKLSSLQIGQKIKLRGTFTVLGNEIVLNNCYL